MSDLREFVRRTKTTVTAVQLDVETDGFMYEKWGGTQRCKQDDWIVNNAGDTYTVDAESFAKTYRRLSPGVYEKFASVWAREALEAGTITTKDGSTDYVAGDFLVFNEEDGQDGYAMSAKTFHELYESAKR